MTEIEKCVQETLKGMGRISFTDVAEDLIRAKTGKSPKFWHVMPADIRCWGVVDIEVVPDVIVQEKP